MFVQAEITPYQLVQSDLPSFQMALLGSSFRDWIAQDLVVLALLAAAFQAQDLGRVKQLFALAVQQNQPTQQQREEWQAIAVAHGLAGDTPTNSVFWFL